MNPFVEECRREWKRLGVPDPAANEMAADLEADLAEAQADGTSPEEVLGTGVFDAPSFAAQWAAERGLVPPPAPGEPTRARRSRAPLAIAAFALVALVGLVLLLLPQPTIQSRQALGASPNAAAVHRSIERRLRFAGPAVPRAIILSPRLPTASRVVILNPSPNPVVRALGVLLLVVGLAGTVLTTLYWVRGSRRRPAATG